MKRSGFRRPEIPARPKYVFPAAVADVELGGDPVLHPVAKPLEPIRDEEHLRRVRALPCCACGSPPPNHPHHERGEGRIIGGAMKAGDDTVVPLCPVDHDAWHTLGHVRGRTREESIALFEAVRAELWVARLEEKSNG